ncbi:sulfite exporter TauE/SafE family protein [Cnuella takakiae]|nr:sulfite exporter TauE/SafE family protein [Cnuella takakiae]OLY94843.1 permease [Cnuella takakiae]
MDVLGYLASLLIGFTLGLIGGGGSMLTMPVLVFLFRVNPITATAYSLFIVGSTSLVGVVPKLKQGAVNLKAALAFGLPSLAAVFFMRIFLVPRIPEHMQILGTAISRDMLLMLVFAALMILASLTLIRQSKTNWVDKEQNECGIRLPLIIGSGLLEGTFTGLVGAGGGFLIIPALVLLNKIPMKEAIGTSLLIIAIKSLVGFTGDLSHFSMDWHLLCSITATAIAGIFAGNYCNRRINGERLKRGFGLFVFAMGIYILCKQLLP